MRSRFPSVLIGVALVVALVTIAAPTARSATWAVVGIDVSHWQGAIDWQRVADSGKADFVIVKATEGRTTVDPMFATNVAGASAQGLAVGAYHVASLGNPTAANARAQADHFLATAGAATGYGAVLPALDIELNHIPADMTTSTLVAWTKAWLTRVHEVVGVRPMIYGSVTMFTVKLGNTTWFADNGYPLWLARWGPLPDPLPANDWQGQGWTFWQWAVTDAGTVPGITTRIDRDRFVGDDLWDARIAQLTVQPGVGGAIADEGGRLDCAATLTCTALFSPNDPVHLTATPEPGYALVSWGGACTGTALTCTVTAKAAQTVTATFSHPLKVTVAGRPGRVTSSPVGIDCPGTCKKPFPPDAVITLTAEMDPWTGVTWSGDCAGTDPNGCVVTMDQARAVTATFADLAPARATLTVPKRRIGAVRVSFDQPVHRVTRDNIVVRPAGGTKLAADLTCFTAKGHRTPCATGKVRTAVLQPLAPLRRGVDYVAIVDPAGAASILDGAGRPTPRVKATFRL